MHKKKRSLLLKDNGKPKDRWYYDACTLDADKEIFREIINGRKNTLSFISHLALGEAYGNSLKKGRDVADSFINLIRKLRELDSCVMIVGNDAKIRVFNIITETFPTIKLADAMHVATAVQYKCSVIRSMDSDLCNQQKNKIKQLGEECGIDCLSVVSK